MSLRPRVAETPPTTPPTRAAAPVEIAIDSVVLHGLPLKQSDADRVRVALVAELTAHWNLAEIANLEQRLSQPLQVRLRATDSPEAIARALASALTRRESKQGGTR